MKRRLGVLQYPAIPFQDGTNYKREGHRPTGLRCPRCCRREIVYNGNYFCSGLDEGDCKWALPHGDPHPDYPRYDEAVQYWTLVDALLRSMNVKVPKWREKETLYLKQTERGVWIESAEKTDSVD